MHKPESVQENKTRKILWDFKMQTINSIPARWPILVLINKKNKERTCYLMDLPFRQTTKWK